MTSNIDFSNWYPFREGEATYLFTIGTYQVPIYTFTMLIGMLSAILTIVFFWMRKKYSLEILFTLILITIPSSIIGARLWFIFERLIYNPADPFPNSAWYEVWNGGLAIQGGVIVPTILNLVYLYFKRELVDYRYAISFILPAVLLGQAIGRWGNYANHEVYGRIDTTGEYTLIWGEALARQMYIYNAADLASTAALRIPLFLYESILSLVGYFVMVWIINLFGLLKPGTTGGIYMFYYGLVRVIMEPLREEGYAFYSVLGYLMLAAGVLMILYFEIPFRQRYAKIKRKYYFDYVIIDRKPYAWLEKLLPSPKIKSVTFETTVENNVESTQIVGMMNRRRAIKKRRPDK
ncbi:prolipoprotein diacylglyceryl transferase [Mycoplasma testudineum]|uniref:Phosphatidylglycerol--prolipoprotein diacylglyceryl transferase n=1 Tax=Mycoplasma testudineum TaxID=244584 RepID=A0A4R6IB76_9MOLU|nr:prolipoprotein diacylglyceryl transferase [Mycoplasma testudineum]OYD26614.1 prolipoprotein diacylglyceryl transferase [Mycoplasma testudineum]TDO19450.1 prolipoprotein diacylglyceryl transferase [Mycoplasma testudineum]